MTTRLVLTVEVALSDQFLMDVLTTWVESGNHWAKIEKVERDSELNVTYLRGLDDREHAILVAPRLWPADVARGVKLALEYRNREGVRPYWYESLREAVVDDDASIVDADLSDVIVQLAAIGRIAYG